MTSLKKPCSASVEAMPFTLPFIAKGDEADVMFIVNEMEIEGDI